MDFGYPQNLSPEILKLYITQEGVRSPFSSKPQDSRPPANATLQVTGAVGWRREGLVYKKNEVFLDIVESVNLLMSQKGEFESASEWTSLDALWRTTFDLKTVTWQIKCLLHYLSSHICNDGHLHFLCFQPVMTCPSEMCQFNQLRVLGVHLMENLFYPCFRHHFAM
jgi:hypothetical protein